MQYTSTNTQAALTSTAMLDLLERSLHAAKSEWLKISHADFLCELRSPLKRRIGMRFSNEFFFVTPAGMLSLDEVPIDCGLIEMGRATTDDSRRLIRSHTGFFHIDPEDSAYCIVTVPAPWRDTPAPTWQFAAAMLRNQQRQMEERPSVPPKQQRLALE